MIKDFLIINITGNKDSIGLRINSKFIIKELQKDKKKKIGLIKRFKGLFE